MGILTLRRYLCPVIRRVVDLHIDMNVRPHRKVLGWFLARNTGTFKLVSMVLGEESRGPHALNEKSIVSTRKEISC